MKNKSDELINALPIAKQRVLERVKGASQWLTVVPTTADGQDLSPSEFRDALTLRYGRTPTRLPKRCDGCGEEPFGVTHALNCMKGGLVKRGHDNLRDACAKLSNQAWGQASIEPVMQEANETSPALIADIKVQGVWESERPAFFDVRIVNADAVSYSSQDWGTISNNAARAKHGKYDRAAEDLRGSFTPLVISCDGAVHGEFDRFLKRLAHALAEKWNRPFSVMSGWVKVKVQIALIRAINLRIRNTRRQLRYLGTEDGAGIADEFREIGG